MEKFITLLFILLSTIQINAQIQKSDWQKENLKGKVKTVCEKKYLAEERFGKLEKTSTLMMHDCYIFNNYGNLTKKINFYKDESIRSILTYIYDYNGRKMKAIKREVYKDTTFSYTNSTFSYNNLGGLVEENDYTSKNKLHYKYIDKYDNNGNLIEEDWYDGTDGLLITKENNMFDQDGNLIECRIYESLKGARDINGKRYSKSEILYHGTSLKYIQKFKYDKEGNLVEFLNYIYNGTSTSLNSVTKYYYVYDNKGNWIKKNTYEKIISNHSIYFRITERTIEYF